MICCLESVRVRLPLLSIPIQEPLGKSDVSILMLVYARPSVDAFGILVYKLKLNQAHHWKTQSLGEEQVHQSVCCLLPFDVETADKCLASFKRIFPDKWRPPWFFLVRLTPRCRGLLVTLQSRVLWVRPTGAHSQSFLSARSNDFGDLKEVCLKTT